MLKKIKRIDVFLWVIFLGGYLVSRLVNLGIISIFTDEAIYLRWSQIMVSDAALRYLPLIDRKPPLFMWLTTIVMKLLPTLDPLLSGRLVSIFAGFGSLVGMFFTSYILFRNKKISYLSSIFYILSPFTLFYDRFALADSLLAMFGIWSLGLGVLLVQTARLDVAMILGMTIGFGLLTKTPAQFFLYLLPLLVIFAKKKDWLKLGGLFVVVIILSQGFFSLLRLFPLFNMINQKNLEFIVPISYFLKHPTQYLFGNLETLLKWEFWYLTPLVFLTALSGVIFNIKKDWKSCLILTTYYLIPLLVMAAFNKVIYPRYLLPFTSALLILGASGSNFILNKVPRNLLFHCFIASLLLFYPIYTNFKLLTDPVNAPLLQADRDQYIDGWAAGYGVDKIREFLKGKTGTIATEGTFGLMPYSLELYQKDYPKMQIKAYWPLPATPPVVTDYLIVYQHPTPPIGWKTEEIMSFRQGKGTDFLKLYKVL